MSKKSFVRQRGTLARLLALLLALLAVGCGEKAKTPDELLSGIQSAAVTAQTACESTDAAAADAAEKQAADLTAELQALAQPPAGADPTQPPAPGSVQAAALAHLPSAQEALAETKEAAALCREKKSCDDRINALSNWPYRKARPLAARAVLGSLALAAGQAQKNGLSSLPGPVRTLAEHAADLADCPPLQDGSPDWPAITAKLDGWAVSPPRAIAHLLAAGWLILDHPDMALIEVDLAALPPEKIATPASSEPLVTPGAPVGPMMPRHIPDDAKLLLLRALIFRECELPRLAALDEARFDREFVGSGQDPQAVAAGQVAKQQMDFIQILLHGWRFANALKKLELEAADREMAELLRRGPDSPFTILLTGERQVAGGQPDKTVVILETWLAEQAKDPEMAWWVQIIQARARVVRDSAGSGKPVPPFLFDRDFLQEVAEHLCASPSTTAAAAGGAATPEAAVQDFEQGVWLTCLVGVFLESKFPTAPAEPSTPDNPAVAGGAENGVKPSDPAPAPDVQVTPAP